MRLIRYLRMRRLPEAALGFRAIPERVVVDLIGRQKWRVEELELSQAKAALEGLTRAIQAVEAGGWKDRSFADFMNMLPTHPNEIGPGEAA